MSGTIEQDDRRSLVATIFKERYPASACEYVVRDVDRVGRTFRAYLDGLPRENVFKLCGEVLGHRASELNTRSYLEICQAAVEKVPCEWPANEVYEYCILRSSP
eukprot:934243-Amphidinium_carterae.1